MIYIKKDLNEISKASELLKKGEIVAFPTETVFGLGVLSTKKEYFDKLVKIKNRAPDKPFTLMCSSIKQIRKFVDLTDIEERIINKFFPGELTLILKARDNLDDYLTLGTKFIGLRIPNDPLIIKMIEEVGDPLLVPSCNPSNLKPALNDKEADLYFHDKIAGIVLGESISNTPSTIIKIENDNLHLIRQGKVLLEEIEKCIKNK